MNNFPRMSKWIQLVLLLLYLFVYSSTLSAQESELNLLLLEVRLDQTVLPNIIPAYDLGSHTMLPLGELARLLSIAIQTQPAAGTATGFILTEERGFSLNLHDARITLAGVTESFDPALVLVEPDDLYVSITLLERWLPVELDVEHARLALRVHPLEQLPLQARLKRATVGEKMGARALGDEPDYPPVDLPYRLWSPPFIDQSLFSEYRKNDDIAQFNSRYTAHVTGDLLGMESSVYFSEDTRDSSYNFRATLGRHDPDAGLLGPLHARTYQFGSLTTPSVENISLGMTGLGVNVSNRPLTRPTQFDRQTFAGDLTSGWDVELFYNDTLVSFQQPNVEGQYRFEDLPLSYGRNDFKLVFHGPLGQTRVEQYSYSLAESMVQPGEFEYNLLEHRDDDGLTRSIAQFDLGLARSLSATVGFITAPVAGVEHQYTTAGLRTFWQSLSLNTDWIKDHEGGSLTQVGLKTGVAGVALDANRIFLEEFYSDVFRDFSDPVIIRDTLRLSGAIPITQRARLPVTIEALGDEHESGRIDNDISARISAYAYRTAVTNTFNWRSYDGDEEAFGTLQISRRVHDISVRGQVNYDLGSDAKASMVALSADKFLGDGYRLTLGIAHELETPETLYSVGFTKSLGQFGLGTSASYVDTGEVAVSLQLFLALGRDSVRSNWLLDARPMASTGAASVRMFLDDNNNGVMDFGEALLPGVGFNVDGGRHKARTDATGIAHIDHLPVKRHVNIGVDTGTLEDPQWAPTLAGHSLVPRPGRVAEIDFPVRLTTEIDGTVYLYEDGLKRGMGGLELELLDDKYNLVAQTASSWDGFYIIPGIVAGEYWLRVSPAQLQRLGLNDTGTRVVVVVGNGEFINGIDLLITTKVNKSGLKKAP